MTLGYPGSTERYLSSYGIEEMMNGINQAMIDVRGDGSSSGYSYQVCFKIR